MTRLPALVLAATILVGCSSPAPSATRKAPVIASLPPVAATTPPPAPVINGAAIVSNNGGGVVSNNGAGLVGHVRAPATILANNGASRRLLALPEQVAAVGLTVRLADAAGQALVGADGKPVEAVTDAQGAYRFESVPTDRAWVVQAELPGRGAVRALALPDGANRQALDLDYVTTLATVYVLEKYVATQADKVATLRKLPASAEVETRERTSAAVAGGATAVPDRLDATSVVAAVESLRSKDAGLDAQLEAVRRLLIPAGQSDLGAGRPALEVGLSGVSGLLALPDGSLLIAAEGDRRAWRLAPDGRITTFAGGGVPAAKVDGQPAAEAGLTAPTGALLDAQGRVVLLEKGYDTYPFDRVTRVGADGLLHELCFDTDTGVAAVPGVGDEVLVVRSERGSNQPELAAIGADGKLRRVAAIPAERGYLLRRVRRYGRDAGGKLWLGADDLWSTPAEGLVVYTLDPATAALARVPAEDGQQGLSLDANGNVFFVDAGGRLQVRPPGGTARVLLGKLDQPLAMNGVALMPDGSAFLAFEDAVYKVAQGAMTLVAGAPKAAATAASLSLAEPSGVAPIPGGGLYVADAGLHAIVKIDGAGKVTSFVGSGLDRPQSLHLDAAGNLYFIDVRDYSKSWLRRVDPAGQLTTLYESDRDLVDCAVTPDGTVYFSDYISRGFFDDHAQLQRLAPGGTPEVLVPEDFGFANQLSLALGPDETIYMLNGGSQVFAWFPGSLGVQKAAVGDGKGFMGDNDGGLAIDAKNRFYFADKSNHTILRWDPATKAFETLAGPGGKRFGGSGVDDGLQGPAYASFAPNGDLLFADVGHKQIKRIAAADL
jgi:sugar lactone lactonase YvrE